MKNTIKLFSVVVPLVICFSSGNAKAEWVDLGTINLGFDYSGIFNLNTSNYVSEPNIASNSLTFNLTNTQTVTFFADSFAFTNSNTELRQIDLLDQGLAVGNTHNVNYITGIGSYSLGLDGHAPSFSYELGPGIYQVNYKVRGQESGYFSGRTVGTPVLGLGDYRLGLYIGNVSDIGNLSAVPEPETYVMLLAGLALIGVSTRRKC